MTIVHKAGNIHKNANGLSILAFPKTPDSPAYLPENAEHQIPIEGINITEVGTEFFEEVRESYKKEENSFELAYKTSIHASTGKTPAILEKGWSPKLPVDTLKKDLVDIHPTFSSGKILLFKVRHHAKKSITDDFEYDKRNWDKSHKNSELKVGDLILFSTLNFNNIKGPKKLKYSFSKPFIIIVLLETKAVQVELSGELEKKHPPFPVSLIKHYTPSDKELFPFRNETPLEKPLLDQSE
ncbi:hypothetical protein O181_034645 [Austropuccinia psidii MF-1]|uniref:Uncharacterized protein n=1 Tax=Austropuccinia psidii MF-1 TaxID=1389203 RepID=A0A9Q3D5D8_9BASI|nr:hypothetical protein [Austropuccinia psidii MF-1]